MSLTKPLAAVSGLLLLGSSIALAQDIDIPFEELDVEGTGVLTLEEALAHPAMTEEAFYEADADGTGVLTPEEYEAFVQQYRGDDPLGGDDPIDEAG